MKHVVADQVERRERLFEPALSTASSWRSGQSHCWRSPRTVSSGYASALMMSLNAVEILGSRA